MARKPLSRLWKILSGIGADAREEGFLLEDGLSKLERFAHFWVLVWSSFVRNRCPVRASALSYSSLLALIPMLAVAMSVTSIFLKSEGEDRIYQFIDKFVANVMPPSVDSTNPLTSAAISLPDTNSTVLLTTNLDLAGAGANTAAVTNQPRTVAMVSIGTNTLASPGNDARVVLAQKKAAQYIHDFIQNVRGSALGALGTVLLIFVAISMFSQIEATFNDIWGVARGRSWFMRIMLYWTIPTLGTLLVTAALLIASGPHFEATRKMISQMPVIGSILFQCLPVLVLWLTFALIYLLVPNTKVRLSAALAGGVVGGSLWHLNNVFGFLYVSRVVTNNQFYGKLGLVPVFMAGLYFSWLILLFGAQVAYAFQNRAAYLQDKLADNVNQRGREFVALRLMTCLGQRFQRGLPPATIQEMSGELGIPSRLVQQVLQTLIAARLAMEISGAEPAYAPARPLETINAHHILLAMRATQGQDLVTRDEPMRAEVFGEFARIQEAERQAASYVTMLALVNRAQARLELAPPTPAGEEIRLKNALASPAETATQPTPSPAAPPNVELEVRSQSEAPPTPEAESRPDKTVAPAQPIAEPLADEDREFPL